RRNKKKDNRAYYEELREVISRTLMSSATPTKSEELERIPRHDPKATPERVAASIVRYVEKALTEAYLSVTPPSPAAPVSAKLQALRLKRLPISRRNQTRK